MKIVDRYVLWEWFKVFLASMGVTLGILLLHDMYNDLDNLIEYGAGIWRILFYYWLLIPSFIPVVLPVSLLISIIFTLGNFHKNNEITALRAAGMNDLRITRSLWFAGFALSGFLFWINADAVPASVEKSKTLFINLRHQKEMSESSEDAIIGKIDLLCFNNRKDSRIWFISKFGQAAKKAYGVEINIMDEEGREASKILAKEGVYDDVDQCWFFSGGQQIFFDEQGSPVRSVNFDKQYYREFTEDPLIMRLSMVKPKDLSLYELQRLLNASGLPDSEAMRPYAVRLASIWASSFACLIVVAIAIPFSIAGVRTNPMVGVSKTAGLFFTYFILDSVFSMLGGSGALPVTLAVWLPNLVMFIFALYLYRKAI